MSGWSEIVRTNCRKFGTRIFANSNANVDPRMVDFLNRSGRLGMLLSGVGSIPQIRPTKSQGHEGHYHRKGTVLRLVPCANKVGVVLGLPISLRPDGQPPSVRMC